MHLTEIIERINVIEPMLEMTYKTTSHAQKPHYVSHMLLLQSHISALSELNGLKKPSEEILNYIKENMQDSDELSIPDSVFQRLKKLLSNLKVAMNTIRDLYLESVKADDSILLLKLPKTVESFEDLQKISSDLKRAIEIPILNSNTEGSIKIIAGESGSIWLRVSLGALTAIKLISAVSSVSLQITQDIEKGKQAIAYTKLLQNDSDASTKIIDDIVKLHHDRVEKLINDSAKNIRSEFYDEQNESNLKIIKESIQLFGELHKKGVLLLPTTTDNESAEALPSVEEIKKLYSEQKLLNNAGEDIADNN